MECFKSEKGINYIYKPIVGGSENANQVKAESDKIFIPNPGISAHFSVVEFSVTESISLPFQLDVRITSKVEKIYLHAENNLTIAIQNDKEETIAGSKQISVGLNQSDTIGGRVMVSAGKDWNRSIGGNLTEKVSKSCIFNANKIIFSAKDEISLKTGKASIIIKNGNISVKGKSIMITGSGDIVIKGKKVLSK